MVGRFQVMALLQAARATALGYPLDEAESFGLKRAIFYAAAKRGFKGATSSKHPGEQHVLKESPGRNITKTIQQDALGDEGAYYVEVRNPPSTWGQACSCEQASLLTSLSHSPPSEEANGGSVREEIRYVQVLHQPGPLRCRIKQADGVKPVFCTPNLPEH